MQNKKSKVYITSKPNPKADQIEKRLKDALLIAKTEITENPDESDIILSVGGDGTVLYKIYQYLDHNKPFICVNAGSVGCLCRIEPEAIEEEIPQLEKIDYFEFPVFEVLFGEGNDVAIQDIRIERNDHRSLKMRIKESGNILANRHNGDGIIIANSAGSTGYNQSAGGQILELHDQGTVVTPVCPIIPGKIYDSITSSKYYGDIDLEVVCENDARLVLDDRVYLISAGLPIRIRKSDKTYKLAIPERGSRS